MPLTRQLASNRVFDKFHIMWRRVRRRYGECGSLEIELTPITNISLLIDSSNYKKNPHIYMHRKLNKLENEIIIKYIKYCKYETN